MLSKTVVGARTWRALLTRPEPMSATTSPGLRRSFAMTSETFGFLAGTSILRDVLVGWKLREAGAFVTAAPKRIR